MTPDFSTIKAGGVLEVPAGTYTISSTISVGLTGRAVVRCHPLAKFVADPALMGRLFMFGGPGTLEWIGGTLDVSAIIPGTSNRGTAIGLQSLGDGWSIKDVRLIGGSLSDPRGDSALCPVGCGYGVISGNIIRGFSDIGIYVTGNSSTTASDDGGPTFITNNKIEQCGNGISVKRQARNVIITGNYIASCNSGIAVPVTGDAPKEAGKEISICGNVIKGTIGEPITIRGGAGRHIIANNRIEDWNKIAGGPGIAAMGCIGSVITGNRIALVDWAPLASHRGVVFKNYTLDTTTWKHGGNNVASNVFESLASSVYESEPGNTANPNKAEKNHHFKVTSPYKASTVGAKFAD